MTLPPDVQTDDGRCFTLREANPGDILDLIEAAGSAASSSAWMRYALMICSVSAIDGKPIMMPNTKQGVRELGRKIGNVGMTALARVHYPEDDRIMDDDAVNVETDALKN